MIRKNYFIFLTAIALFLVSSIAVFAQAAPVRGKVELKKADGTTVPAAEAAVDVYRTDAKGKLPSGKANKRGEFSFAGLPVGQTFMFVISAPGVQPQVFPNIKAGQDGLIFTVYEGDGKRLTEEEARQILAAPKPTTGGTGAATTPANPQDAAAAKKAQEEYEKQVAEVTAKNKRVENINQVIDKAISEGKSAFDSKNYDVAIVKFGEGYAADPEFAGTAPTFLNNRALALRLRGFESYKKSTTDTDNRASLLEAAKKDFSESISDFQKSLAMLKAATPADARQQKDFEANRKAALAGLVESYRLLVGTRADDTKTKEAAAALAEYDAAETDDSQKAKVMISMADTLRLAGDSTSAVPIYKKIYEKSPDNPDVLGGLGLSLFDVGVSTSDRNQMQEGLNLMERFAQVAPDTHPMKNDIRGAVEYLKTTEKLTPQKVTKPTPAPRRRP
jgi:tetratricopeptide (TPR) repeat protein